MCPPDDRNILASSRIDKYNYYFWLNLCTANGKMRAAAAAIPFIYAFFSFGPKIGADKNDTNKRNNDEFCVRIYARDDLLNATEKLSRTRQPYQFLF